MEFFPGDDRVNPPLGVGKFSLPDVLLAGIEDRLVL
jgi:hypothetical protein